MKKRIWIAVTAAIVLLAAMAALIIIPMQGVEEERKYQTQRKNEDILELFHDPANEYISPAQPTKEQDITLRLRTEKYNVTRAQILYTTDAGITWQTADMAYEKHDATGYYDYFVGTIPAQTENIYYRFICGNDYQTVYLDRSLLPSATEEADYTKCWSIKPGNYTPDWAMGALWYNINPDAFYNGDTSNDTANSDKQDVAAWDSVRMSLLDKYGGDLEGIMKKVEHIQSLYVDVVYMNPFNKSSQNAGYDPAYYTQVDSTFGNAEQLKRLSELFHDRGIKVGSDAVMTFTNNNNIYFNQYGTNPLPGAYQEEEGRYNSMYLFYNWPDNFHDTWGVQPALNHASEVTQELLYTGEDSFLQYYTREFSLDTWRFDCGGWLQGWTDEGEMSNAEVIGNISDALTEINPDVLLVSENCTSAQLMEGDWDSHWNVYYMRQMAKYAEGVVDERGVKELLDVTLNRYPRPLALAIFNPMATHDEPRTGAVPTYMENAQLLTFMNYIGSPSIYYGEEINLGREKETGMGHTVSFYAMEWDASNWDYERLNLLRALGELRSKYTAVKTGAVRMLQADTQQNLLAFGRWDDDSTVITVASQNEEVAAVQLNARKLGAANGAVFTDWLTGKQYTVDGTGMLNVEVIPGGSVFVTGTTASKYRQAFCISNLGTDNGTVIRQDTDSFLLEGEGRLAQQDSLVLASAQLFGAGEFSAAPAGDGKAVLTLRESAARDSAAYNVVISEDKLEISARRSTGGNTESICTASYTPGSSIKIVRNSRNEFSVAVAEKDSEVYQPVEGSQTAIAMEHTVQAGMAPIAGSMTFAGTAVTSHKTAIWDDFDGQVPGAMLTASREGSVDMEGGKLVLTAEDGISSATTGGMDHDWSFKAKLDTAVTRQGEYAGVICFADDTQFVVAGRTVLNGKAVLFTGRSTDGRVVVDSWVEDTQPTAPVIVQLQRTGPSYGAVYSYDGEHFSLIDSDIFANYSCENVGVFAAGNTQASFDYACFGSSIHDGSSVNTPYASGLVETSFAQAVTADLVEQTVVVSGDWEYGAEGYYRKESTGTAQLGLPNKVYQDVRINLTLQIEAGTGYAGIGFGKGSYQGGVNDGFLLKYTPEEKLVLLKNGTPIASATVRTDAGEKYLRVMVEVKGDAINIYAGQTSTRVMRLENTGYRGGQIALYAADAAVRFMNYRFTTLDATWQTLTGGNTQNTVTGGGSIINCTGRTANGIDSYGVASLSGVGVTDCVAVGRITRGKKLAQDGSEAETGMLFCASVGRSKALDGLAVALTGEDRLVLLSDGQEVAGYALNADKAEIMVVKQERQIRVYVRGTETPVITYEDTVNRGGAVQLYAVNNHGAFSNIGVEDIHGTSLEESRLYLQWQAGKCGISDPVEYKENFDSASAWTGLTKYNTDHGTWVIEDGVLSCVESPQWASGVTMYESTYGDFQMEFKYRYNESSTAWSGILLRKQKIDDNNGTTPFSILIGAGGGVFLYDSSAGDIIQRAEISDFVIGNWYELKIVCQGDTIRVYKGTQCLLDYQDSRLTGTEGFVSLTSNKSMISFDDIWIQPIEEG